MLRRSRGELTKPSSTPAAQSQAAFARVAARTLAPSPIRDLLHRRLQPFRHLHDCSGCFRLERLAGWDLHPLESAAFSRRTQRAFALCACKWFSALLSAKRWRTRCGRRAAIRRAADFRKLRRPPARSSTTSQRRLRPSAMLKGFGRRPLARRLGEPPGAGVRKPRKEETAGRKGAVWWGAAYGDF